MDISKNRLPIVLLWAGLLLLFLFSNGYAQLLYRPGDEYENYGKEGYKTYGKSIFYEVLTPIYDEVGDFVMYGREIYHLRETQTMDPLAGSRIYKDEKYYDYVNKLVVVYDTYNGWATRLTVGDNIRTKFTPLSLDMAALNGVRWDVDLGSTKFTAVASRVDRPLFTERESEVHSGGEFGEYERYVPKYATYLLGGHWETQIGILNIGGSYVNQYRIDSLVDMERNSLKGVLPERNRPVRLLVVKVADGSEFGEGGARVYGMNLFVNGVLRKDIPVSVTRHDADIVNQDYPNGDRYFPYNRSIPPYVEFLKGAFPTEVANAEGFFETEGTEVLLFWFDLPQEGVVVESAEFQALVANDYDISLSEVYVHYMGEGLPETDPLRKYRATYFYRAVGSEGNPGDISNLKTVRFKYGRQTSDMIGGFHVGANMKGLELKAEYKRCFDFRQFPSEIGDRFSKTGDAFYVNVKKDFHRWFSLGGEYFSISPYYTTSISVQDASYGATYLWSIDSPFTQAQMELENETLEFGTVDDNDDKDRFPDTYFFYDRADNDGVFPGEDKDLDGRPDTNENNNDVPDYSEPFLLYNVNPEEFDYGDDLNNNGIMDQRENDDKPDYPYDADLKGVHGFARFEPGRALTLTLGIYDTHQIVGGGKNVVSYAKAEYSKYMPFLADVYFVDFAKRVRDDIRNDVFQFQQGIVSSFNPNPVSRFRTPDFRTVLVEDLLVTENSFVNTCYLRVGFLGIKNVQFEHSLKYEWNRQFLAFDRTNDIHRWGYVGRADYTYRLGKLIVSPQVKYMARKVHDDVEAVVPIHETFFYPILRADYVLTPRTTIKSGVQGVPFLKSSYHNILDDKQDYASQDVLIMLTNKSIYRGYEVSFNVGYECKLQTFKDRSRSYEDVDYSLFFMRLMVGLETI